MSISLLQKAHQYLLLRNLVEQNGRRKLTYFQKSFWIYENGKWIKVSFDDMISDVMKLADEEGFLDDTRQCMVKDLVRNLQAISSRDKLEIGSYIGTVKPHHTHYVPLQNGILKITRENNKITYELSELTPDFFSTYILPYKYDHKATCNNFLKFLSEILSPDEIKFIRQWIGYCLIPVTFAEKFLIAFGNGANGKSVLFLIIILLIGEENVSHVLLQGFVADSDFTVADTVGKLCNIVQEIDDIRDVPTGFLKEYVSGEEVRANEKFRPAYDFKPTARLMFATNFIPVFKDDSDGFMRRIIILPFNRQFLASEQDKRFKDKNFWIQSGELSGIFNWALEGLNELMANNWEFFEPNSVKNSLENFKATINPILQFLEDNVEASSGDELSVTELYRSYQEYCRLHGFYREHANTFARSVRKVFPSAVYSKNPRIRKGKRTRLWFNIRFITETPSGEAAATLLTQETQLSIDSVTDLSSLIESEEVFCANIRAS